MLTVPLNLHEPRVSSCPLAQVMAPLALPGSNLSGAVLVARLSLNKASDWALSNPGGPILKLFINVSLAYGKMETVVFYIWEKTFISAALGE